MKKLFLSMLCLGMLTTITYTATAQDDKLKESKDQDNSKDEEIIIRKNGNKDSKITLEMKDDELLINGKPLSEYKDGDVTVIKRRRSGDGNNMFFGPEDRIQNIQLFNSDNDNEAPKALLGVTSEKDDKGVKISRVSKGSAAEKAGLKPGDIIIKLGNKKINDPEELMEAVTSYKPKDEVKISYERDGKSNQAKATLGEKKNTQNYFSFKNNMPPMKGPMIKDFKYDMPFAENQEMPFNKFWMRPDKKIGVRIEDTENNAGAKITNVEEGSAAEKAGLKKDDIITEVNGEKTENVSEASEQVLQTNKENFTIKAKRGAAEMSFEIKMLKKMNSADL